MSLGAAELLIILVIVVLPLLVGLGVAFGLFGRRRANRAATPLETLQDRFARGELSQAEFEQHKAVLTGQTPPPDGFA